MFSFYRKMKWRYKRDRILNSGLLLALEFGKNLLQPIQERLGKLYPLLSEAELDSYNEQCHNAMKFGREEMLKIIDINRNSSDDLFNAQLDEFVVMYKLKFPWIEEKTFSRLYSQNIYYSMK